MEQDLERYNRTSHDLDMVTLQHFPSMDGRMQAELIHSMLESYGIYSLVSGAPNTPLGFDLKVARANFQEANRLISEGKIGSSEAEASSK